MPTINWKLTDREQRHLERIVERVTTIVPDSKSLGYEMWDHLRMDLTAVHNHCGGLDLARLAEAKEHDLMHDIGGIRDHLNRTTIELERFFVPRFALPEPPDAA